MPKVDWSRGAGSPFDSSRRLSIQALGTLKMHPCSDPLTDVELRVWRDGDETHPHKSVLLF